MAQIITGLNLSRPNTLVPLIAFGIYCVYYLASHISSRWRASQFGHRHGCKPPVSYPHIDPVLGLDVFYLSTKALNRGHLMDEFDRHFKTTAGGVYTFSGVLLGDKIIHTIEPENVKAVFATNFKDYSLAPGRMRWFGIFGPGIFANNGHNWEESRALMRPNFVRSQVGDIELLEVHVSHLLEKLLKEDEQGVVDLQPLFHMLTMDWSTAMLLGESVHSLLGNDNTQLAQFCQWFDYVSLQLAIRSRLGKLGALLPSRKFNEGVRAIWEFAESFVDRALAAKAEGSRNGKPAAGSEQYDNKSRYVFLNEIINSGYNKTRIVSELLHILVAGRDTTASLLSVYFYTIVRHPDVFQRLHQEILQEVGATPPSYEQLKDLKYLSWTLKEVHRLYPIIPLNSRISISDTVLPLGGGKDGKSPLFVRKGTRVVHYPYSMHRRKDIYGPDAEEFRPERWNKLRTSWEYLPFSGGPRVCIGQSMAITAASYTIVRVLQTFKNISPGDESVWAEKMIITMSVRDGCHVRLAST